MVPIKNWLHGVQHNDESYPHCIVYLQAAKRIALKGSQYKKKLF